VTLRLLRRVWFGRGERKEGDARRRREREGGVQEIMEEKSAYGVYSNEEGEEEG